MADKFPSTVNAFINFVAGEQPTADKFNALVAQTKYGFSGLESAVGDIHNGSWPYIADDAGTSSTRLTLPFYRHVNTGDEVTGADAEGRSLDIVSLARLIGPASNLNPLVLDATSHQVTDELVTSSGVTEFQLRYPVSGTRNSSNPTFSNDTNSSLVTFKSLPKNVQSDGDYTVSGEGTVLCFKPIASGVTATYNTDPMAYAGGPNHPYARFNVIPDPNQVSSSSSEKVVVSSAGADGLHTVQLPLITHQQTNYGGTTSSLTAAIDLNYQVQAKLPFVLTENMSIGQSIPSGFLYLKNVTTNEVYTDATYIYNDEDTFQVGNVDLEDRIAAGDTFQVLTVGVDITSAILDLQFKLFKHRHTRSFGERAIRVGDLVNNYREKGSSGTFMPSTMNGNTFAQYLHRDGYRPDDENTICNDANAMRGNLVFGKASGSPGEYIVGDNGITTVGDTYGISFGGNCGDGVPTTAYGPVIYGEAGGGDVDLVLETQDSPFSAVEVRGDGRFKVSVQEDIYMIAYGSAGADLIATTGDLNISANAADINIEASDQVNISSTANDVTIEAYDNIILRVDPAASGATQRKIILDCPGWATIAEDGGTTGYDKGVLICDSDSDTGTGMYSNSLFQVRAPNNDGPIVTFDNTSNGTSDEGKILELRFSDRTATQCGSAYKDFVTFRASDRKVGRIESRPSGASPNDAFFCEDGSGGTATGTGRSIQRSGDVAYISGNNDFGEAILAGDVDEWKPEIQTVPENNILGLSEGMVVFVRDGKFWRSGPGTPMVVTNRAVLIGNSCEEIESSPYEILSFIGQVPVWIKGSCKSGDYLVPTEENCCVAIDPDDITFSQYKRAIGTAWEASEFEIDSYNRVLCAIGIK